MSKDNDGREYAKVSDIVEGSLVEVDGDFTCITPFDRVHVHKDSNGLYIPCSEGSHYLDGQIEDDYYLGLYHVK